MNNFWKISNKKTGEYDCYRDNEVQYISHETINEKEYIVVCTDIEHGIKYYYDTEEWEMSYNNCWGKEISEE